MTIEDTAIKPRLIHHLRADEGLNVGNNIYNWINSLPGPSRIEIPGVDSSRCRVLVTLLHGNEPSGLMALHRLLKEQFKPQVTVYCYVIALESASLPPQFTHRQVPGKRDYNRCFLPPYIMDHQGLVCEALLNEIRSLQPEAVVDMHNTSGEGPSFGVTVSYDVKHDEIIALFTRRLIVTNIRLGSLMESNTAEIPVVTIECGGAFEESAHRIAYEGLFHFFSVNQLFGKDPEAIPLDIYYNPLRIEMHTAKELTYGESPVPGVDITLLTDIEHHNFGRVSSSTQLGWISEDAMEKMAAFDAARQDHFKEFYREENGMLYPRFNQKMFMITADPVIAKSDCLWYVVPD
jgi:hypothetical protein